MIKERCIEHIHSFLKVFYETARIKAEYQTSIPNEAKAGDTYLDLGKLAVASKSDLNNSSVNAEQNSSH